VDYTKIKESIKFLLEGLWFPNWIHRSKQFSSQSSSANTFFISHDDCDGFEEEGLSVTLTFDGDVWLSVLSTRGQRGVRYRMPMQGGGQYPKIRNALLVLAEAIRQTNEEQQKGKQEP
jgi:hypothetical protein